MSDDLVKIARGSHGEAWYVDETMKEPRLLQLVLADEITRLRDELATARREGVEQAARALVEKYQSMVIRPNTPEAWRISILQDLQEMAGEKPNIITAVDIDAAIRAAAGEGK